MDSVVKIFGTHAEPNYSLPWQRRRQTASTSSGFIIDGRRLLTNAHCVEHGRIKVRRRGHATKFPARIVAVGVECDLALLEVPDPAFWEGAVAVRFGGTPLLQQKVVAVGFPLGGDTVSATSGVVSRVEVQSYTHGSSELLAVTIDAAINSGASGGAVFNAHSLECVGVSFQSMAGSGEAELVGHAIPVTPIVRHFLGDVARHGRYTGFPVLGVDWQRLESPSTRAALGMGPAQTGVFVRRVDRTAPAAGVVRAGDVLLAVDGVRLGNDGTIPFRPGERLAFSHAISTKFVGDAVALSLLRDGAAMAVSASLRAPTRLAPVHLSGAPPSYMVWGGLVFTPLNLPFLKSEYGKEWEFEAPLRLLELATGWSASPARPGQQVVVLSSVLTSDSASDVTFGLEDFANVRVASVDGVAIDSMAGLVGALEAAAARARAVKPAHRDRFARVALDYGQLLIVDAAAAEAATPGVMATHGIEHDRSPDLRGGGGGKRAKR
jgi:S1-C subfamily serine protease